MDALRVLRVNVVELLRQPGLHRDIAAEIAGRPLGVEHERVAGDIAVDLALDSMNDGIVVTGEVRAPWATSCRRCLKAIDGVAVAVIDELYQVELTDPDAFPIEHNQLDLAPMVRENALLELAAEQLCQDECAGLCPVCGIDRNTESCECDVAVRDHRWDVLDGLVLDD